MVGAGPAGLCASIEAASMGANVLLIDSNSGPGGQLLQQSHKFFGSWKRFASRRGFEIAKTLYQRLTELPNVTCRFDCCVLGYHRSGILSVENKNGWLSYIQPKCLIIATGAAERSLSFQNNDLPGIYGAGAVQILMNSFGVVPGRKVLMIGAGNVGLIVAYQLLQAGADVAAIVEAAPEIGGYWVHASKVARYGVPILTGSTIVKAIGHSEVEGAVVQSLVDGSEKEFEVDCICIAVGLYPVADLLFQAGCEMKYVSELGGHFPVRNRYLETSVPGLFVAGDVACIEEATTAMVEGMLAGKAAAAKLGYGSQDDLANAGELIRELESLRNNPLSANIRAGLQQLTV